MAVEATKVFQLKVTLRGSKPAIWRRLLVPEDYTLGDLHAVLQESFGWDGSHLHQFVIGRRLFGEPDADGFGQPVADEYLTNLRDVARPKSKLLYEYDFGDSWQHEIVVERVLPAAEGGDYPTCTAGRRAGPPEDSGGVWGYEDKLAILADPDHEDHEDIIDWMPEGFSPEAFDREALNRSLAELGAARESARDAITDLHALDHDLVERMLHFAKGFADFHLAADLPVRAIDGPEEFGMLIAPWAAYEYALGEEGDTLRARFLSAHRPTLSSEEVAWLEAQGRAWFAPWEVVGVVPGASVDVRDLLTGEARHVTERGASQVLRLHDVVLARVVEHGETTVFCGMHPHPLGPRDGAAFVEAARKVLRRTRVARLTPDMLREPGVSTTLIRLWEELWDAVSSGPMPALQNSDGEPLVLVRDELAITGALADVRAALLRLPGATTSDALDFGGETIQFLRGAPGRGAGERTEIGRACLSADAVVLETTSRERAKKLRKDVERACKGLVRFTSRSEREGRELFDEESSSPGARGVGRGLEETDMPPEVSAMVRAMKTKHYAEWCDVPVPALGNLTPRAVAASGAKRGRAELELMMKEIARIESAGPADQAFDVNILRHELGLLTPPRARAIKQRQAH